MDNLQTILQGLSQEEQAAVIKILTEQSQTGSSVSYSNLIGADYDEIPVSIQEFIESPKYARNYIQTYYPFWKEQLINIFDRGKHYSEIAFTGSIGTGKAQPENAMILGQNGYFRMGDAKVGMKVFGEDGKLHNIVKVWPQGEQPVYKITFNDGTSVECEEDHLWNIRRAGFDSKQRVHLIAEGKGWETKSVRWLLTQKLWVNSDKKDSKGYRQAQRQFYIPITKPLEFENDYELPIHPYLLGQLIAEGSLTSDINVSIYEQDIREKVNSLLLPYGCYLKVGPEGNEGACEIHLKDYDRTKNMIHPIKKIIKELNLNVTAMNKHIPKMYLYSTVENRIQLLQGLFDGDGCIQDGQYTYFTSSEQLYKDITFLIESLGGSVYLREGKDSWYTVKDERIYTGNKNWEFYFKFPKSIIPFTSKKHSNRFGKGSKFDQTYIFRFIDKIEYVGRKNCLCITTDNPEGLYLTEHCIVTHNSSMAIVGMAYELYKLMCLKNPQKYWGTNKTIFFAFFNNNLDLARSVGFAAFHDLVKKSEWFLDHGEFRGKVHQVYYPYKDIELMAGSLPSHVIGKDVFCLTGDTKVLTDKGIFRIDELAKLGLNDLFRVKQVANNGYLVWSNKCLARQTKVANHLLKIIFEDNTSVKCTPDHLFLMEHLNYSHGYDLNPNDYVYAFNNTSCRLKIKAIERIYSECGEPVYDIICAYPFNNFAVYLSDEFMIFPHNCALQDELNFAKGANMHLEQNKILETYNNIYERISSRFTRDGVNWGTMFLVSSKKSEYDFLESYIRRQKGKPHFYVADAKIWDVKPMGVYSGKKFNLAVGGSNLPSKIIPDDEDPKAYERQGYEVIQVPIEHKQSFELDMQSAIMNVAGISISHVLKFMNIEQIQKCYTDDSNPFVEEVIKIGLNDSSLIQDYFKADTVPEIIYSRPIFIHLDMAVSGDNAGIGAVAAMGFVNTSEYDINQGKVVETRKMAYRHVFNVEISAPKNDQIHFAKVREFLYYLKFHLGWNIRGVSADGFNCLTKNNTVITNHGVKPILFLNAQKDEILSYDIENCKYLFTHFNDIRHTGTAFDLLKIWFYDSTFIECTENHLIYVEDKESNSHCYRPACELNVNDWVVSIDSLHVIRDIQHIKVEAKPVYDIEVPKYNNFVLGNGVIVHNSVDMRQQLSTMGFHDVSLVSLDRSPDGYMALRSAIAEKRIALLNLPHLEVELAQLERDNVTGKIDHPLTGCFTGDTKVSLVDGRNISILELLQNGYHELKVWSVNESTHVIQQKRILNVFYTKTCEVVELKFSNTLTVKCTEDHLFMLRDGTYKQAKLLSYEDELFTGARVIEIKHISGLQDVYDLTIEDNPNFMLSCGVIVHNSKDGADGLAGALYNALLHEKDLANDISDLVDIMVETNDVHVSTAEVIHTSEPVIQSNSEQPKLTAQEIIEEAKRRSHIEYNREPVGYRDEEDEPFDPSSGILI